MKNKIYKPIIINVQLEKHKYTHTVMNEKNKTYCLLLSRFKICFSCLARLKTPVRQNSNFSFSLLKALRVYKLISHLLLPLTKEDFFCKSNDKVLPSPWTDSQSEKKELGKDFSEKPECILISVNHLAVSLNIYLWAKLKWIEM